MKNICSVFGLVSLLFLIFTFQPVSVKASEESTLLMPIQNEKRVKLNVANLPQGEYVTLRVRDRAERLVQEFKVKNTGQDWVVVNFEPLVTGKYSLNIVKDENQIIRKNLLIYHDAVVVRDILTMSNDVDFHNRWPWNMAVIK
ncbi:MAG: hypothetical protein JJU28_12345 [Cyclobacteriaceae bacterium]|nr:hypothetical protein [Cyclobacteriaceae bacterium]